MAWIVEDMDRELMERVWLAMAGAMTDFLLRPGRRISHITLEGSYPLHALFGKG